MPKKKRLKKTVVESEDEAPGSEEEDLFDSDAEDDKEAKKKAKRAAKKKAKKKKSKKADSDEEEGAADSDSDAGGSDSGGDGSDEEPLANKKKSKSTAAESSDDDTPLAKSATAADSLGPRPDWGPDNRGKTNADRREFAKLSNLEQESKIFERSEAVRAWDDRQRAIESVAESEKAARAIAARSKESAEQKKQRLRAEKKESVSAKKKSERDDLKKRKQKSFVEDGELTDEEEEAGYDDSDSKPKKRKRRSDDDDAPASDIDEEDKKELMENSRSQSQVPPPHSSKISLDDINSLQLKRVALEKLIEEPFFAEFVPKKFVRMNIGQSNDGTAVYRMCEVVGVDETSSKMYPINPDPKMANKKTSKRLLVALGEYKRAFPMSMVSNQKFTQEEMDKYLNVLATAKGGPIAPPTAQEALSRRRQAKQLQENFVYTPAQVAQMLKQKKVRNFSIEMTKLKSAREDAKVNNNEKAYNELTRRIEELDELELTQMRRRASVDTSMSDAVQMPATNDAIAAKGKMSIQLTGGGGILDINRRHQMENHLQIDKANEKVKKHEETYSAKRADPFKRRLTRPAQIWSDPSKQQPTTPTAKKPDPKASAKPAAKKADDKKGGKKGAAPPRIEDDVVIETADRVLASLNAAATTNATGTIAVAPPSPPQLPNTASAIGPDDAAQFAALKKNLVFARLSAMHSVPISLDLNSQKPKLAGRLTAAAQHLAYNSLPPHEFQKTLSLGEYFKRREEGEASTA